MPYDEFVAAHFDHDHYEWVDGEVIEMSAIEDENNAITVFLCRLLGDYVELRDGGTVRVEPFQMYLQGRPAGRAPDLQVILKASVARLTRLYLDGPADVVVEVTSTSSRTIDRRDKFREYQEGGVPEYWIIDPLRKQAEFYVLENGHFVPAELDDAGLYHSRMLQGVWIDVNWLWNLPAKNEMLKQWGLG